MAESTKEKYIRQSVNFLKQTSQVFINEGYFGLAEQCKELVILADSIEAPSITDEAVCTEPVFTATDMINASLKHLNGDWTPAAGVLIGLSQGECLAYREGSQINFRLPHNIDVAISVRRLKRLGVIGGLKESLNDLSPQGFISEINSFTHLLGVIDDKEVTAINSLLDGDSNA